MKNNLLGGNQDAQAAWIRQHGTDMASCADAPGSASCQKATNERDAVGLALATGSVALLPGSAQAMWGPGAGANAGISYLADGTIDPANAAMSGGTSAIGYGVDKVVQGPLEKLGTARCWYGDQQASTTKSNTGIAGNIGSSIGSEGSGAII